MRRVLVESLLLDGYEVYEVGDGAALLTELARNNRFHYNAVDVVVADVRMPLCSGLQVLETIRGIPLKLPFVLLTAFPDTATKARANRLDAVLLDKPVSMDRLRGVVGELIAKRRQSPPSPSRPNIR